MNEFGKIMLIVILAILCLIIFGSGWLLTDKEKSTKEVKIGGIIVMILGACLTFFLITKTFMLF